MNSCIIWWWGWWWWCWWCWWWWWCWCWWWWWWCWWWWWWWCPSGLLGHTQNKALKMLQEICDVSHPEEPMEPCWSWMATLWKCPPALLVMWHHMSVFPVGRHSATRASTASPTHCPGVTLSLWNTPTTPTQTCFRSVFAVFGVLAAVGPSPATEDQRHRYLCFDWGQSAKLTSLTDLGKSVWCCVSASYCQLSSGSIEWREFNSLSSMRLWDHIDCAMWSSRKWSNWGFHWDKQIYTASWAASLMLLRYTALYILCKYCRYQ